MEFLAKAIISMIPKPWQVYLSGKKTYIICGVAAVTAGLEAAGVTIPGWVYVLEGSLGLGAIRIAISKNGGAYQAPKE